MTRTLTFTGSPEDAAKFVLLYNAFVGGGNRRYEAQRGQRPADERRKEGKILRALNGLSDLVESTGGRKLKPEGATLTLEQPLFLLLEQYVEAAPLPTDLSLEHADLLDWLSAADKQEGPA